MSETRARYRLQQQLLEEQRRLEAQRRAEAGEAAVRTALASLEEARSTFPHGDFGPQVHLPGRPDPTAAASDWDAYRSALERLAQQLRERTAEGSTRARVDAVIATLGTEGPASIISASDVVDQTYSRSRRRTASVNEVLASLHAPLTDEESHDLADLARSVVEAENDANGLALELKLRSMVEAANRGFKRRQRDIETASEFIAKLEAFDPAESVVRGLRDVVESGAELSEGLRREASRHVAAVEQEAEAELVLETLTDALTELGYRVHERFDTIDVGGDRALYEIPGYEGYFLAVSLDPATTGLHQKVVRAPGVSSSRAVDLAAEQRWCGDVFQVMHVAGARGLALDMKSNLQAGASELEQLGVEGHTPELEEEVLDNPEVRYRSLGP